LTIADNLAHEKSWCHKLWLKSTLKKKALLTASFSLLFLYFSKYTSLDKLLAVDPNPKIEI